MKKIMTDKEFEEELKKQKWIFAKTYAKTFPHWYFLKKDNPRLYEEIVRRIKEFGKDGYFFKKKFRYYYHGKYKYWAYDTLINRDYAWREYM